jgi:hypothetical protein
MSITDGKELVEEIESSRDQLKSPEVEACSSSRGSNGRKMESSKFHRRIYSRAHG